MKFKKPFAAACILSLMGPFAQAATILDPIIAVEQATAVQDSILLSGWMTNQLKYAVPFNSTAGNVVPSQLKLFGFEAGVEGVVSGTKVDVDGLHNLNTKLVNSRSIDMFSRLPLPLILGHAKIGLPFGFDAGVRLGGIPKTEENSGNARGTIKNKIFGLDLRKKIIEEGTLKPFGLTVGLNYTHADGSLDVTNTYEAVPQSINILGQAHTININGGQTTDHADWKTNSVGLQAILDKQILFFTPYIGGSVNRNSGDINNSMTTTGTASSPDFVGISQDFTATGASTDSANRWDVRALAGFELNVLPFVKLGLQGEYAGNKNMAAALGLRAQFP